ncbi:primosomal protein N' [Candidatus Peregrinibacteria bacterium]|nr:primosomal protein N' [Candidatus Peregrinibacteria bacterium]MBI3816980.1 primosomal protein N' [Candidatus Peregrinibacteria bacterium]
MYCTVVTSSRFKGIGNGLTYELAEGSLQAGSPVRVPLRNRLTEGIVVEILEKRASDEFDLKQVKEILGKEPLLTEAHLKTARWISEYYICTLRQALGLWLPAPRWTQLLAESVITYRITEEGKQALADERIKGKKQKMILQALLDHDGIAKKELYQMCGNISDPLRLLREKKFVLEEKRVEESSAASVPEIRAHPQLTEPQQAVYEQMKGDLRPSLLFGVTGSGKTELYAKLIVDAMQEGKQAILLVPEILLTEHSIQRFEKLLPRESIAVIHSRLTAGERRAQWKKIRKGEIALVIGSRSALFSPLPRLGIVIIDEEHEWTYKNEQTPRYHARETAEELCRNAVAKLVMGTATPSLEAWARAKQGRYQLVTLPERYQRQPLPSVGIIDLGSAQFGSLYPFSLPLLTAIGERLERKEQAVLFLNRRGVASALLCRECRRRVISPDSQLPFSVHHDRTGRPFLVDHTTGVTANVPSHCPHCRSPRLMEIGAGTQKVEQILKKQFHSARLIRMDSDTIRDPSEMRIQLEKMQKREADILLGTQSVVKGLDLPHVTLAAVLLADIGLSLPHFRAGERIFQLLTQLTGRSGRARPGEVIIQTFRPDAPEVIFASRHQTEQYLESELQLRIHAGYPPATQMVRLLFRGEKAEANARRSQRSLLELVTKEGNDIRVHCAPAFFGAGRQWHVLLRGSAPRTLLAKIDLDQCIVDIDPMETM